MATAPINPAQSLRQALDGHESLGQLMQRVKASRDCLAAIIADLPDGLRTQVQAGPLDETGWTILAANGSAAAKLRQLLPIFEARLRDAGLPGSPVAVKVLKAR